jgi:hypothetical protein
MITGSQIRMARAALHWRVNTLAEKAGINWARMQQMEKSNSVPSAPEESLASVKQLLESEGVVFTNSDDGWVGIKIRITGN